MSSEHAFLQEIQSIRQTVVRRHLEKVIVQTCFWALIFLILGFVLQLSIGLPWAFQVQLLGSFGAGGLLALGWFWGTKKDFQSELIDLDERHSLNDRISTAYEFHKAKRTSPFKELLFQDAHQMLQKVSRPQRIPFQRTWIYWAVPILGAVLLLAYTYSGIPWKQGDLTDEEQVEAISELSRLLEMNQPKASRKYSPEGRETSKELQTMLEELQKGQLARKEMLGRLEELNKKAKRKQERLHENLKDSLSFGNSSSIPMLNNQGRQPNLQQLREQIENRFESLPNSLSEALKEMELNQELQDQFEQSMKKLQESKPSDLPPREDSELREENGESDEGRPAPGQEEGPRGDSRQGEAPQYQDQGSSGIPERGRPGDGNNNELGDSRFDKGRDMHPRGPGSRLGPLQRQAPQSIEKNTNEGTRARSQTGEGTTYSGQIRSLSKIGQSDLDEQAVIQSYEKQVEQVLNREAIPPQYRDLIKNYFLSIQLIQEKNGNTGTR